MDLLLVLLGATLLYAGGEALVRGSVDLARLLGMSPVVIGLTVVSFGTSAPELASTLAAALRGSSDVAFGNVVGSNVANIGLILGLTAMIWPIATTAAFLKREVPFMLFASGLMFPIVANGTISRVEGGILFALLILFLVYLLRADAFQAETREEFTEALERDELDRAAESKTAGAIKSLLLVAVGITMLVFGARALVTGGINIARLLGVSERVIGLSLVALGTSLPELASSVVAAMKRESGILLGNLIGSNVFNILCILGLTVLVRPINVVPGAVWGDLIVMLGSSALVWPFLASGLKLQRWEGFVLLAIYVGYMISLFG